MQNVLGRFCPKMGNLKVRFCPKMGNVEGRSLFVVRRLLLDSRERFLWND